MSVRIQVDQICIQNSEVLVLNLNLLLVFLLHHLVLVIFCVSFTWLRRSMLHLIGGCLILLVHKVNSFEWERLLLSGVNRINSI